MEWLPKLLDYGSLGLLCLALVGAVRVLWGMWTREREGRAADAERHRQELEALQDQIQAMLEQRAAENAQRYADLVRALGERQAKSRPPATSYSHTTETTRTRR